MRPRKEPPMAAKKGTGLLMVWADVPADKEADFNRWYNEEHLAERLAIAGFLSGARYEAMKGGPKHLAVYELESPAVLESEAYKKVQANPTPWTQRSGPREGRRGKWPPSRASPGVYTKPWAMQRGRGARGVRGGAPSGGGWGGPLRAPPRLKTSRWSATAAWPS